MRKFSKTMALLLALALVFTTFGAVTVSAASFSDTQGHWAEGVIDKWSGAGVVNGYSDGTFKPDNYITRAELAKVISTARQYTASAEISFSDVAADDWYAEDLKKCVAAGVIGGYEDGTFKPDNNVTREEAAAMFQRAYQVNSHGLVTFADSAEISPWAQTAVTALVGTGVINGYPEDNTFRPAASITRAEVVKVLDGITAVGTQPGATTAPGQNNVSAGSVVTGGLGGSGTGGFAPGGLSNPGTNSGVSVTFNANGGKFDNGKDTTSITISKNSVIGGAEPSVSRTETIPAATADPASSADPGSTSEPEVITYNFGGWYMTKAAADTLDASKAWDVNNNKVTSGMTLYAGWYLDGIAEVMFETNAGSEIETQFVNTGETAVKPAVDPVREHYTFLGWYSSNVGGSQFDFPGTPIRTKTTVYARWSIDPAYADQEITLPTNTVNSHINGTISASPASALPGEKIKLTITPPDGYFASKINSLSYTSSETNAIKQVTNATLNAGIVEFTLGNDVIDGTIELDIGFEPGVQGTPAPPTPEPTEEPTAEPAPIDPDLGPGYQSYKFSYDIFVPYQGGKLPAKTDFNGLSVDSDTDLDANSKTFSGSGRSYTHRLKPGTKNVNVKVYGPCDVIIDAVSASSQDRTYDVKDNKGNILVDDFVCENGALPTCKFRYEGGEGTLTITGNQGINIYGIILYYGEDFPLPTIAPTPTVEPTPDPATIEYNIKTGTVSNGTISSSVSAARKGETVTMSVQPDEGYKVVNVYTEPGISLESTGTNAYSFTMPDMDVTVSARIVPQNAELHVVKTGDIEGGTIELQPSAAVKAPLINSTEAFLKYNKVGAWLVSSDGRAAGDANGDPTAVETNETIKNNKTNKLVVTEGAVEYILDNAVGNGPFTFSYDMLQRNTNMSAFKTYFDNKADAVDPETGKALGTSGTDSAFFHMIHVNDRVYVTSDISELDFVQSGRSNPRSGVRVGTGELDDNKWYRVVITGNMDGGPLTVAYYKHGANGDYSPNNINTEPDLITTDASFTTGREALLKQIRLMRTTSGTMYYDNINLIDYSDDYYKAYEGETFKLNVDANLGYELGEVIVTDSAGNKIPVAADNTFTVPAADVTVTATFIAETPEAAPEGLKPITDDYTFIAKDHFTHGIDGPVFCDENRVYLSGSNSYSSGHGTAVEIPGHGVQPNVLGIEAKADKTKSVVIQPAFDAEITVYGESLSNRTIIAGKRYNSAGLYLGEYSKSSHTFTVEAGTTVFITGANRDLVPNVIYISGITVKHIGAAASEAKLEDEVDSAEAADADAVEADSAVVDEAEPEEVAEEEAASEKPVSEEPVSEDELPTPDEAAKL